MLRAHTARAAVHAAFPSISTFATFITLSTLSSAVAATATTELSVPGHIRLRSVRGSGQDQPLHVILGGVLGSHLRGARLLPGDADA